jgi:hypothetical protein
MDDEAPVKSVSPTIRITEGAVLEGGRLRR